MFCLGIVVLFTSLGLLMKAIARPFGLGATRFEWFGKRIHYLGFILFAVSLLSAFELALPSGLLAGLDQASQGSDYAGTLLMSLTFSLTSFACVGPIVERLIVASVTGSGLQHGEARLTS